jgi:hypothetical protein
VVVLQALLLVLGLDWQLVLVPVLVAMGMAQAL